MEHACISPEIDPIIKRLVEENPDRIKAARLRRSLLNWFVGQVMKETHGMANPETVFKKFNDLIDEMKCQINSEPRQTGKTSRQVLKIALELLSSHQNIVVASTAARYPERKRFIGLVANVLRTLDLSIKVTAESIYVDCNGSTLTTRDLRSAGISLGSQTQPFDLIINNI